MQKIGHCKWLLPISERNKIPITFFINDKLMHEIEPDVIRQAQNATTIKGATDVILTADCHVGAGVPIGSIIVTDPYEGSISIGAVGADIACGMRVLLTDYAAKDFYDKSKLRKLMAAIEEKIPTGLGKAQEKAFPVPIKEILKKGVEVLIDNDFGLQEDLEATETYFKGEPDISFISETARQKAIYQVGTLGSGNHFIEIQEVTATPHPLASQWGLHKGQLVIQIHSGSRRLGYQVNEDLSKRFLKNFAKGELIDKDLVWISWETEEAEKAYQATVGASNYAMANRQAMTYHIRQIVRSSRVLYDLCHNTGRFEYIDNKKIFIHRKGATRALPAGHPDNVAKYKKTGHPILIPGSMGTNSYILVATPDAKESFYTVNHGSGRTMSRHAAKRRITNEDFIKAMGEILFNGRNPQDVIDEAPQAYKNIEEVIDSVVQAGLAEIVAVQKPLAVIKGKDAKRRR